MLNFKQQRTPTELDGILKIFLALYMAGYRIGKNMAAVTTDNFEDFEKIISFLPGAALVITTHPTDNEAQPLAIQLWAEEPVFDEQGFAKKDSSDFGPLSVVVGTSESLENFLKNTPKVRIVTQQENMHTKECKMLHLQVKKK